MKTLIITVMPGDLRTNGNLEKEIDKSKDESGETVSLHQFDMLSQAYEEKFAECEILKAKNQELKEANIKLMESVNKYRYFIECQRNEIEQL